MSIYGAENDGSGLNSTINDSAITINAPQGSGGAKPAGSSLADKVIIARKPIAIGVGAAVGIGALLWLTVLAPRTITSPDGLFVAVESVMTQTEAQSYCQSNYGELASIHSAHEQTNAANICKQLDLAHYWDSSDNPGKPIGCWIGFSDLEGMTGASQEEAFAWTDGSKADFTNWGIGEPNGVSHGTTGGEDHVAIVFVQAGGPLWTGGMWGLWNDVRARTHLPFFASPKDLLRTGPQRRQPPGRARG